MKFHSNKFVSHEAEEKSKPKSKAPPVTQRDRWGTRKFKTASKAVPHAPLFIEPAIHSGKTVYRLYTPVVFTHALVRLVVNNNIEKGTVDYQPSVVMNETQLLEFVHEEVDPRPSCTYHFREGLLAHLSDCSLGRAFLSEMSKQEENPG